MSNEQVAPETKGVTVKLLSMVDLGPEIEGTSHRQVPPKMGQPRLSNQVDQLNPLP